MSDPSDDKASGGSSPDAGPVASPPVETPSDKPETVADPPSETPGVSSEATPDPTAEASPEARPAESSAADPTDAPAPAPMPPMPVVTLPALAEPPAAISAAPAKPKVRDWVLTLAPVLGLVLLMSHHGHLRGGVVLGFLLTLLAVTGLLGLIGDSPLDLRGDERAVEFDARPWWRREGTWVLGFSGGLYLPFAGAYGLWDPWETHYSEVAREILSRDDWITTWWGQEGWFMSKPVLIFWMSAMGMGTGTLFGLRVTSDSGPQFQEWCIRVPICLLAMAALFALYRSVAAAWGKRAGVLVAMVLATMPHWFFLAHQAMTDMPFVAPLTLAIAMLMRAVTVGENEAFHPKKITLLGRAFRVSLWHQTLGVFLTFSLPQVLYLLTRPMVVSCPDDARMAQCQEMLRMNRIGSFQFPVETYFYGSAGNSGTSLADSIPGSPGWERLCNVVPFFPSVVQGVLWTLLGAIAIGLLRRERRLRDLYFILFYIWCAISTMGKGPAGLAIPVAVAGIYLVISGDLSLFKRARIGTGILAFLVVGMPWYVAILGRLGNEFFDRFVVHDIINRTIVGVHGDTGTVKYFVWQLGYAMFPWTGLVPSALVGWRQIVTDRATEAQRRVASIGVIWFLVSFFLFSAMITKFHHYIFPAVPGAAVMVGLLLDRMLGSSHLTRAKNPGGSIAALTAGLGLMILGVADFFGSVRGVIPNTPGAVLPPGNPVVGGLLCVVGLGLVGLSWALARGDGSESLGHSKDPARDDNAPSGYDPVSFGAMAVGAAAVLVFVARDLGYHGPSRPPGYQRLLQLFTYQYERQWPTATYDFHHIMIGFGAIAVVVAGAMAVHRLRAVAVRGMVVVSALFTLWALDVYMVDISHHWSQRGLFERYYTQRHDRADTEVHEGEDAHYTADPLGAYQMNWKGENFYTGGHAAMLDCGDLPFCSNHATTWLPHHLNQRVFFVTERAHGSSIIAHVRHTGGTATEVSTEYENNKFVLIEAHVGGNSR